MDEQFLRLAKAFSCFFLKTSLLAYLKHFVSTHELRNECLVGTRGFMRGDESVIVYRINLFGC